MSTNSAALLLSCRESFPDGVLADSSEPDLRLRIRVSDQLPPETLTSPVCRGRNHLAFCYLGGGSAIVFDYRSRTAAGCVSRAIADNDKYWREVIFPFVQGLMSPVLNSVPLHAACVVHQGAGVVIGARSGMGKSTLVTALARKGATFVSDDWAYLNGDHGLRIYALPVPLKLLPDSLRFFPELQTSPVSESQNGELCMAVDPGAQLGALRVFECRPKTVIVYHREHGVGMRVRRAITEEVVECFSEPLDSVPECLASHRDRQLQLLARFSEIDCYVVTCDGTPDEIAEKILKLCDGDTAVSAPAAHGGFTHSAEDLLRRAVGTPFRTTIAMDDIAVEIASDTPILESRYESASNLKARFTATVISEPRQWPTVGRNFTYRDGSLAYTVFGRKGVMVFDSAAGEAAGFVTASTIRNHHFRRQLESFVASLRVGN